jgi:hypothetical protein
LEEIENGFNFLFSFYKYSQKSRAGDVVVSRYFVGEDGIKSNVSDARHAGYCSPGTTLQLLQAIGSCGLKSG